MPPQAGLVTPGNIDLSARPRVTNADGTISTVRSLGVNIDGREVLIPTVIGNRVVSDDAAIREYQRTGQHLGIFDTPAHSAAFAQTLHESEAAKVHPMPQQTYSITAPNGKTLDITGDHVPTEAELHEIFAKAGVDTAAVTGAHPEARMSAAQPGLAWAGDPEAVTLGDLRANPVEAIGKIGAALKRDLTDPTLWMQAAAAYFGPKAFNLAAPVVMKAAGGALRGSVRGAVRGVAAVGDAVSPDVIGAISPRAGKVVDVAQRLRGAMPARPTPPLVPEPAPVAPTEFEAARAARQGAVPAEVSLKPGRPGGNPDLPNVKAASEARLAEIRAAYQAKQASASAAAAAEPVVAASGKMRLTAPEMQQFTRLINNGVKLPDALEEVKAMRDLASKFGLSQPTAADTRFPKGARR